MYFQGRWFRRHPFAAHGLKGAGKAFSSISRTKPGFEMQAEKLYSHSYFTVRLSQAKTTTSKIITNMWSIAKNSADQERAMPLLNLLYTDKNLINLFT
jgi:putative aldouronate transport system substrate-binding protein